MRLLSFTIFAIVVGDRTGAWSREHECSSTGAVEVIYKLNACNFLSTSCWHHFVVAFRNGPAFFIIQIISRREGSHFYIYDDAIIYSSTASYFGAEIILKTTNRCTSMVGRTLLRLFVVVEQFYDRPEYV